MLLQFGNASIVKFTAQQQRLQYELANFSFWRVAIAASNQLVIS